jgi:uncharacterized protein YkwD
VHHSPSGSSFLARLQDALYRVRLPRRSLRGTIAPVVLVCGVLAGIALVLPSYAPAVTGTNGALGLDVSGSSSAGEPSSGAPSSGRAERAEAAAPPAVAATPSVAAPVDPAPTPVETTAPTTEDTTSTTQETQTAAPKPRTSTPAPAPAPAAAPAPVAAGSAGSADASAEGQILALVNQQRAAAGCGAVAPDDGLASVARAFSAEMRDRGFFSHTDPDGLSPFDRGDRAGVTVLGENIAYGQPDPASVMTAWMNSPGHRANILDCSYTKLGVGVAYGPGGPWWTQDFA